MAIPNSYTLALPYLHPLWRLACLALLLYTTIALLSCQTPNSSPNPSQVPSPNPVPSPSELLDTSALLTLPKTLYHSTFVNLLDTTTFLDKRTSLTLSFDSIGIHFEAELEEPNIQYKRTERDADIWKDPCIEIFLDPGADGLNYYEIQFNALPQVWDLKLKDAVGPINATENMLPWDIGTNYETKIIGTTNEASDIDKKWILVGSLTWDRIAEGRPKAGDIWSYNIMRVDYNTEETPSYWVVKPTGKGMIHVPKRWARLVF